MLTLGIIIGVIGAVLFLVLTRLGTSLVFASLVVVCVWDENMQTGEWWVFWIAFALALVLTLGTLSWRSRRHLGIGVLMLLLSIVLASTWSITHPFDGIVSILITILVIVGVLIVVLLLFASVGAAVFAALVVLIAVGAVWGFSGIVDWAKGSNPPQVAPTSPRTPSQSPSTTPTAPPSSTPPSPPPAATAEERRKAKEEAAQWVRDFVLNFKGVYDIPTECADWSPDVDLTSVQNYNLLPDKESKGAFGPAMGDEPCEVSRNMVERLFRDPMLIVDKLDSTGIKPMSKTEQHAMIRELADAPFAERLVAARRVLEWYTDDKKRELRLVNHTGPYESEEAVNDDGVVTPEPVTGDKPSTVLETVDKTNGKVVKRDRMDCGGQDFHPKPKPRVTPTPRPQPKPTPTPSLSPKSSDPKDYVHKSGAPKATAAGSGTKATRVSTTSTGGGRVTDSAASRPGSVTGVTAPGATPASTTTRTVQPTEAGSQPTSTDTSCAPPPGMTTC